MASNGIPVITYGRHVHISQQVADGLAPEYDGILAYLPKATAAQLPPLHNPASNLTTLFIVVHAWIDLETAKREIPLLLSGDKSFAPREGVGSNAARPESERRVPRAALCGGGVPDDEFEDLKKHVSTQLGREIPWFKIALQDIKKHTPPGWEPSTGPVAEFAVKALREKLAGFE